MVKVNFSVLVKIHLTIVYTFCVHSTHDLQWASADHAGAAESAAERAARDGGAGASRPGTTAPAAATAATTASPTATAAAATAPADGAGANAAGADASEPTELVAGPPQERHQDHRPQLWQGRARGDVREQSE